jgi:hypothetical protein
MMRKKCAFHHRKGHESPEGRIIVGTHFNLSARWREVVNAKLRPLYPPRMIRQPLYRRLGGSQGRAGRVRKTSPQPEFDPRTVQHIASCYTDYTILAH